MTSKTTKSKWKTQSMLMRIASKNKTLKTASTPSSQLPTTQEGFTLKLGDVKLQYQNNKWRVESDDIKSLRENMVQLISENKKLVEEKLMTEYKNELLLDMLTLSSLDVNELLKLKGKGK